MSIWCMDCRTQEGDEPCPCCSRSSTPTKTRTSGKLGVRWIRVQTARGLVLVRVTDDDLRDGAPAIDLREVT